METTAMTMADVLRDLRQSLPGCRALGLADLSTSMLLKADSEEAIPQERWDELVAEATTLLTGPDVERLNAVCDPSGHYLIRHAIVETGGVRHLFLRSNIEPPMGYVLICDDRADVNALITAARPELEEVAALD